MSDSEEFPSMDGIVRRTWSDYDPTKLSHVNRYGSNPVEEDTLREGDILIVTESGSMDLVEVLKNDLEEKKLLLAYHTSFGKLLRKPELFVYAYGSDGVGRAYLGQWLRIFEIGEIPPRYLEQALGEEEFLPQENYL